MRDRKSDPMQASPHHDQSELTGKAADRRFLEGLRPVIERAAREGHERGILKATIEAQKRLAAEQRQKRDAEIAAAVSIVAAKEKERGQRKNAAPEYHGPTLERAAKLAGVESIAPPIGTGDKNTLARAHLTQGVVEFYREKWTDEELAGARFLVNKWNAAAIAQQSVTANYDGTPAGAYGPRQGGLRGAPKTVNAYQEVLNIEAILFTNFGAKGRNLVKWFCWETVKVAREGAGMGEQMEAAGKALAPFVHDRSRLWGITFGSLQTIFRFAYGEWVVREEAMRRKDSTPQQIAMRRTQRLQGKGLLKPGEAEGLLRADRDGLAFKREGKG